MIKIFILVLVFIALVAAANVDEEQKDLETDETVYRSFGRYNRYGSSYYSPRRSYGGYRSYYPFIRRSGYYGGNVYNYGYGYPYNARYFNYYGRL